MLIYVASCILRMKHPKKPTSFDANKMAIAPIVKNKCSSVVVGVLLFGVGPSKGNKFERKPI